MKFFRSEDIDFCAPMHCIILYTVPLRHGSRTNLQHGLEISALDCFKMFSGRFGVVWTEFQALGPDGTAHYAFTAFHCLINVPSIIHPPWWYSPNQFHMIPPCSSMFHPFSADLEGIDLLQEVGDRLG